MSKVILHIADEDKKILAVNSYVCFGQMPSNISSTKGIAYIAYVPYYPIDTDGQKLFFDWMKSVWDFPTLWPDLSVESFNKGYPFFMDVRTHSVWDIYNYFSLVRYLDPHDYMSGFTTKFKEFADKLVDGDRGLNLAQVFVLTNLFGGMFYTGSHALMCRQSVPAGNIEAIQSAETFKKAWPKNRPAIERPLAGWGGINQLYAGLLQPNTLFPAAKLSLDIPDHLKWLFPTKWEFVNERLNVQKGN